MYSIKVVFMQEIKPDLISKIIMLVLGQPYSHVGMLFEDVDGKVKIFHAIGKGVCVDETCEYLETHKIVKAYSVKMKATREEFAAHARARCGIEYSESQYWNQFLKMLGIKHFGVKNNKGKSICSEEVAVAAYLSELPLPSAMEFDWYNPEDIDNYLDLYLDEENIA